MEKESKLAGLTEIKKYFEFISMEQFRKEWNALSEEDKEFFKVEVGKIINSV